MESRALVESVVQHSSGLLSSWTRTGARAPPGRAAVQVVVTVVLARALQEQLHEAREQWLLQNCRLQPRGMLWFVGSSDHIYCWNENNAVVFAKSATVGMRHNFIKVDSQGSHKALFLSL